MTDEADGGRDDLAGTDPGGRELGGQDLAGTDLRGADLAGVDLSGTDLSGASLTGADLHDADLSGTDLHDADLRGADLSGADLSDADLSGAAVTGADLHGATLDGAELAGADLRGADVSDSANTDDSLADQVGSFLGVLTLVAGLGALAVGFSWFWMIFVVGWIVVTPIAQWLARHAESDEAGDDSDARDEEAAALDELRGRYARGDIGEAEFERRVERLLETESVDDASSHYGPDDGPDGQSTTGADGDARDHVRADANASPERETE